MKHAFPFAIVLSLCLAAAQPKYIITDLGTGAVPEAGINRRGEIAGWAPTANPFVVHAFRTPANGVLSPGSDLGTLGVSFLYSEGRAINNKGQVTGASYASFATVNARRAFRTVEGAASISPADNLGTLGGAFSDGFGINTSGQVVGVSARVGLPLGAFRTGPNLPINPVTDDLGSLSGPAGFSFALGINDSGQVVGYSQFAPGQNRAFRTAPGCPWCKITPADDLGTLGGNESLARAINSSGQVTGHALLPDGRRHAFRTGPNLAINPATDDLGSFGGTSYGWSINSAGDVVGLSSTADGELRAFLHKDGVLYDLNNSIPAGTPWTRLEAAYGINDRGQIAGYGFVAGDPSPHAFRLDPPEAALGILVSKVESSAQSAPLTSTLNAAGASLGRGNTRAAANQLRSFISQVEAMRKTGRVDEVTAAEWIESARAIIEAMS